jgi:hypothetical protein
LADLSKTNARNEAAFPFGSRLERRLEPLPGSRASIGRSKRSPPKRRDRQGIAAPPQATCRL